MILDDVHRGIHKRKQRKRLGRGTGSGYGKTCGRGHKGYGSRSGSKKRMAFEGGQMPLARRIPKRGFSNARFAPKVAIVNLGSLEAAFEQGATVTPEILAKNGVAKGHFDRIKILGDGTLNKQLTVRAHGFSRSAEEKIVAAGGTIERIGS